MDLSWKPDADADPQQQDSPHRWHAWETEEPLLQHGWKQSVEGIQGMWGSSLPITVELRPHFVLQKEGTSATPA